MTRCTCSWNRAAWTRSSCAAWGRTSPAPCRCWAGSAASDGSRWCRTRRGCARRPASRARCCRSWATGCSSRTSATRRWPGCWRARRPTARGEPALPANTRGRGPLAAIEMLLQGRWTLVAFHYVLDGQVQVRIDAGSGDDVVTRFVCGDLGTPVHNHPLLDALPPLLVTRMAGRPCADWVESSFRFAAQLPPAREPGARDMLARALSALHAGVARPWTTDQLADEALLSRSAFAERFARTLGVPPMTYLTRWRMLVAAQKLRESRASIARIAAEVGYESESSFTRAFCREMQMTPGAFRPAGAASAGCR